MKAGTAILIAVGVAAAGGGAYLLIRRRPVRGDVRELAAANSLVGARAVSQGGAINPNPGTQPSPSYTQQVLGMGGKAVDLLYPGAGTKAAQVLSAIDSKVPLSKAVSKGWSALKSIF